MRLIARIARLEQQLPKPPGICPCCGYLDQRGSGLFSGGTIVPLADPHDGWWCMCRYCHRRFTCHGVWGQPNVLQVTQARFMPPYPAGYPRLADDDMI